MMEIIVNLPPPPEKEVWYWWRAGVKADDRTGLFTVITEKYIIVPKRGQMYFIGMIHYKDCVEPDKSFYALIDGDETHFVAMFNDDDVFVIEETWWDELPPVVRFVAEGLLRLK